MKLNVILAGAALASFVVTGFASEAVAPAAAKADLAKGEASFNGVCAACHGPEGNSVIPVNPKLAQQHPDYLVKQLTEFKAGKRENAVMLGMSAALSEGDMKNIAAWLATKKATPGESKDKDAAALHGVPTNARSSITWRAT